MDILIIDKDASIRAVIKEFCARTEDVNIVGEAETGAKGIQAAETLRPDLLLIAAGLPDRTGFDVLRAPRRRHQRRSIMLTDDVQDAATGIAAGAVGYLVKPLTEEAFSASLLRARRATHASHRRYARGHAGSRAGGHTHRDRIQPAHVSGW